MNNTSNIHISIVSPVYKAEKIIDKLVDEIIKSIEPITKDFEIILVEDGSPDKSWEAIERNCKERKCVKGIKLSRNFGQHYAITAGLNVVQGRWIVVMDCDLQDKPNQIHKLYNKALEGYDIVYGRRKVRQDSFLKKFSSRIFYSIFSYFTETKQDASIANFGVYNQKVVNAILQMEDHLRYFPTMSQWVGFKNCSIDIDHGERENDSSSYTWSKLIRLALDNIIAFSNKPLKLTVQVGFLMALVSGSIGVYFFVRYLLGYIQVEGFTSLIISLWFLSGLIIFFLGMIGIYIGKTFEKVKNRPSYIVDKIKNL